MLTQTQISLGITIVLFIFSAVNFWLARKGDVQKDTEGTLKANLKLDSLCASMTDTRVDIKGLIDTTQKMTERQIRIEQEVAAAWKRIDELKAATKDNHTQIELILRRMEVCKFKEDDSNGL